MSPRGAGTRLVGSWLRVDNHLDFHQPEPGAKELLRVKECALSKREHGVLRGPPAQELLWNAQNLPYSKSNDGATDASEQHMKLSPTESDPWSIYNIVYTSGLQTMDHISPPTPRSYPAPWSGEDLSYPHGVGKT